MTTSVEEAAASMFAKEVSDTCLQFYDKLPSKIKPNNKEWTVLSCILESTEENNSNLQVVAAGIGTKCLGSSQMDPKGLLLNDSHAEVMARRGFLRYLYEQILFLITNNTSRIFYQEGNIFKLKENITFHFYTSQTPCGDASIVDMPTKKRSIDDIKTQYSIKKRKIENSDNNECESKSVNEQFYENAPVIGLIGESRCKPGRGDQTLSSSCSDKIARWIRVGLQGGLLSQLIDKEVLINTIVVGGGCPYSFDAMSRALFDRGQDSELLPATIPVIRQHDTPFQHCQAEGKNPSPISAVWCSTKHRPLEVAVNGRRLGTTKKNFNSLSCSLLISKINLFTNYLNILKMMYPDEPHSDEDYEFYKNKAVEYNKKSDVVKRDFLKIDKPKPKELLQFKAF